ncbi:hypothetical protein [Kitasatospora purpeofusca]|uniref:hypothetical protein n=1 Tax=Kitasatospora purpeofusca TaxID=67352 RepID=UPI002A59AA37|nr:hypothetical protein [Kitasatospora purpeofusca]MDY0812690.1 hypothetical protein [Kitasatospora purpeofusca]
MRRAPRHWHSVARSAVTALLGAALVLLGGAAAAEARPWVAGVHCVTAQEAPAGGGEPLPLVAPGTGECSEPAERRRSQGTVPLHACAHRAGPARMTGCGRPPLPHPEAYAVHDPARPAPPWPPYPGRSASGAAGVRGVVLRC